MFEIPVTTKNKIIDSYYFTQLLTTLKYQSIDSVKNILKSYKKHIIFPLFPELKIIDFLIDKTVIKSSASSPIILHFNDKQLLFKFEDIRKDQIIMAIIKLIEQIITFEEQIDLHIISYNIYNHLMNYIEDIGVKQV